MSKPAILLSVSGALLASSTLYLASELREEKARRDDTAAGPIIAAPAPRIEQGLPRFVAKPTVTPPPAPTQPEAEAELAELTYYDPDDDEGDPAAQRARIKAQMERQSREFLREYDDPGKRERMLAAGKSDLMLRMQPIPGLTDADLNDLADLQVRQRLAQRAEHARCVLTEDCNHMNIMWSNGEGARQEIAALLGPEKFRAYEAYTHTAPERGMVAQLRLRLDDANALSEENAERLVKVLFEERRKYEREAQASGVQLSSVSTPDGIFYGQVGSGARDMDLGLEFSKRLRKRASEVLSASQVREFDRMQEALLLTVREYRREEEIRSRMRR